MGKSVLQPPTSAISQTNQLKLPHNLAYIYTYSTFPNSHNPLSQKHHKVIPFLPKQTDSCVWKKKNKTKQNKTKTSSAMMKRAREEEYVYDQDRDSETANFLMLLSKVGDTKEIIINRADFVTSKKESSSGRVFTCKTCNREFPSFQALGGHRASHKKLPKLSPFSDDGGAQNPTSPPKPKTHECSICGLEFAIGQALGGHMRRHRQQVAAAADDHHDDRVDRTAQAVVVPVLRKSSSSKRVCADLDLDLHLGPPGDHYDLKLRLMASTVGC